MMPEQTAKIRSFGQEHQALRAQLKMFMQMVDDWEKMLSSIKTSPPTPLQIRSFVEKTWNLQVNMTNLEKGIIEHYQQEENWLRAMLGDTLMEAIAREHVEIHRMVERAKALLAITSLDEHGVDTYIEKAVDIKKAIGDMSQLVEAHSYKEDVIQELLTKILEARTA